MEGRRRYGFSVLQTKCWLAGTAETSLYHIVPLSHLTTLSCLEVHTGNSGLLVHMGVLGTLGQLPAVRVRSTRLIQVLFTPHFPLY